MFCCTTAKDTVIPVNNVVDPVQPKKEPAYDIFEDVDLKCDDSCCPILDICMDDKKESYDDMMRRLEAEGIEKAEKLISATGFTGASPDIGNQLLSIMKEGEEEFKAKTGRNMSYGEMRALYG